MRRLVHLSDLHFGRTDVGIVDAILEDVIKIKPDIAAISGDFTQRARSSQFKEAAEFLKRLPCPHIEIPGNHDIPLYDWRKRLLQPLRSYRRYINTDTNPILVDSDVIIAGMNTVTRWRWKEGRVRLGQIARVVAAWGNNTDAVRVMMLHHPPSAGLMRITGLLRSKPDLILSGHLHRGGAVVHPEGPVLVAAGTAISNRLRGGEANAYNVIEIEPHAGDRPHRVRIITRAWTGKQFDVLRTQEFEGQEGVWKLTSGPAAVHVEVSSGDR
ncbi:MAG: metallophosphoesterase [Proteobacteria bacterium]|nr:MAG: metallophosphoesterase [Pseudomonadota bacterium]